MCGIAGLLNLDRDAPADAALVRIAPLYVATTATPADDRSDADEKFVRTRSACHPVEEDIRA